MGKQDKDWEGAASVDSFREGRRSHMEEAIAEIRYILAAPDPAAAMQAWSQRMRKAIEGAKT
jgi:hypothetical protein